MKFLILDPYYPAFLKSFYQENPKAKDLPYHQQQKRMMRDLFGTADFYSKALTGLGHQAHDITINNQFLQQRWLDENTNIVMSLKEKIQDAVISRFPIISGKIAQNRELKVLERQINHFKPDILYSHNLGYIDPDFLQRMKPKVKLIVGQIACPLPFWRNFDPYDLIITSFPHYLPKLKRQGIKTEYLPLCFEASVLDKLPRQKRVYDVTFIGGISRAHKKGYRLLNQLAEKVKFDIWGYGKDDLDPKSKLYQYHHGEAWGKDMYRLMLQSKITLNRHIDVAENNANNMRLYEATGCGAMLLTDQKDNLGELFVPGKEVVTYKNLNEIVSKIKYYLTHESERSEIAKNGQKRTLKDHTYEVRMAQLINIIKKYL
ncbi:hypothetical protein A2875_00665 [Candidatus Gottesmanbacteria bacterium RIFCSPHIGHO2_01_FULL_46_14]|uniref:Spore protein YkvP/CgeB glycosyl transferase-like domain-containing protein n=2 Tax=Patescibacteria group TaxID=1783273 RepID=A0A1F5ZS39_9BACT|nr:MAG: hypothetical protein A2875_00665 [Candidatus Gottesmanbacteria bacterium RIFCSPHIGHO2_01_FULL_46_14]